MTESRFFLLMLTAFLSLSFSAPARATEVSFRAPGASKSLTGKLRDSSLALRAARQPDATPQDILAAARADYANLIGVLYAEGFFGNIISIRVGHREVAAISPLASLAATDKVSIVVQPGPPFLFSEARIAPLAPGTELPDTFAAGHRARGDLVREAAAAGVDAWRDVGHAKAGIMAQTITADHRNSRLSADITLAPGPRLTFGDLAVTTSGRVRPGRIRAIAGLPKGEVFSPDAARKAAERLRRTGAFQSVSLTESEAISPGNTLDFNANVVDAKRRRIGAGLELSSLEGLTVSGFWLHRNLLGGAERFRVDGAVGGIGGTSGGLDYQISTRFDRPATFTPDTGLFLLFRLEDLDEPDYKERNVEFGGGLTHIFSDHLRGEAGIAYRYSEIDDDLGSRNLQHLLFPSSLTWDSRDNEYDATRGLFADFQLTPLLGLDRSSGGARIFTDARTYRALPGNRRIVLAARAQAGSVVAASVSDVPSDMLFFSGGAGTVRGQPYQSLAVDLGGGNRIGGRSFIGLSGEVRADAGRNTQAVVFADTGFIGQDSWASKNGEWHSGAGLGMRYKTGIGPIRVDVATPLDNGAGQKIELYIGIGQAF